MAWTEITRAKYQRDGLRYASDTTDEEWALIEPHIPPPASRGRTRETGMREVVNSHHLHRPSRLPVAPAAQGVPALHNCAAVYLRMARQQGLADHQPCPADGGAGGRRPRGKSDRRSDRQPVGQDDRGRWSAGLRCWQEDQRSQAPYSHRYNRPAGRHDCAWRGCSGPGLFNALYHYRRC